MLDEQSASNRRIVRVAKFFVIAAAATIAGWYAMQFRAPRRAPMKTASQHVAVLRDHDASYMVRLVAAEAIDRPDGSVVGELTAELSEGDAAGRELAAYALGRLRTNPVGATDALIAALEDRIQSVRQQAAVALGRIGERPEEAAAALAASASSAEPEVRGAYFKALRRLGDAGVRRLLAVLGNADADARRRAVIELGRIANADSEVLDSLRGCLRDGDPRVRAEAHAALREHSASRAKELIAALSDADPIVQSTACTILAQMGSEAEAAIPELAKLVAANGPCAWSAGHTLLSIRPDDPQIVSSLAPLIDSEDKQKVESAAMLFLKLGRTTEPVRRRLLARIDDPRDYVADRALEALRGTGLEGRLRPPELIDALEEAGDDVLSIVLHDERLSCTRARGMSFYYPRELSGFGATDQDLARLAGLRNLRLLDLSGNPIGDAGLDAIAELEKLEWLFLYDTQITSAGLVHLAKLPRLRSLALGGCNVTDEGLDYLQNFPAVEAVDLRRTQVTDAGMNRLAGIQTLKAIWLDETQVTDAGLANLAELPLLEDMGYVAKQFTLRGLAQLKRLVSLRPPHESVSDDDLALLSGMSRLRELVLSRSGVTDAGVRHIAKLTQLELLWLDGTAITDEGLMKLRSLSNLKFLALSGTRTTDHGLESLQRALPKLEWPVVRGNTQLTATKAAYEVVGLKPGDEPDAAPSVP